MLNSEHRARQKVAEKGAWIAYLWLWLSIATTVASGLLLKEGTRIVGEASENFSELPGWMLKLVSNPYTLSALFSFALSAVTYTMAMSRLKLSYVMPLSTAIPLVSGPIFALLLFKEKVAGGVGWESSQYV